jgi:hypothetical protein
MLQLDGCEPITMELKHVTQRNTQPIRPQQNRCLRSPERPTKELVCAFDLLMILCVNFRSKMISANYCSTLRLAARYLRRHQIK